VSQETFGEVRTRPGGAWEVDKAAMSKAGLLVENNELERARRDAISRVRSTLTRFVSHKSMAIRPLHGLERLLVPFC
jgi:hypothetical protein